MTPLAVTMGEPAGIGGEITLAAWRARDETSLPPFFTIDDPARLERLARALGRDVPVETIDGPGDCAACFGHALPVLPVGSAIRSTPGRHDPADAASVITAIEQAVALCQAGAAAGLVTNPINKHLLYETGFRHPGHTEFIGALCGSDRQIMMLAGPRLRVVPATIHCALSEVMERLSTAKLIDIGRLTAAALTRDFAIAAPRLAISGLNPHAGENGAMGREEIEIIAPAIEALRADGLDAAGPVPADSMFHEAARRTYDAAICMYHDQALIPVKTLDFDRTVNVTLGLPVVRTSPDHGTAFDIAGKGVARADSLIAAIRLAGTIAENRRR